MTLVRRTCFVLTPLGPRGSPTRLRTDCLLNDILTPALDPLEFDVVHADHLAMPGDVRAQVFEYTITAELVIADVTEKNPNVYLELGVRLTTGKPTILVSRDLTTLPFDIAGLRTIPIDDTNDIGRQRAIRELRRFAQNILAVKVLPFGPVTDLFVTTFTPRDRTMFGEHALAHRRNDNETRHKHIDHATKPWLLEADDRLEESLLTIAQSKQTQHVAMLMLQRLLHEPYAGQPLTIAGEPRYVLRVSAEEGLPPLLLVYALAPRQRLVRPLLFFRDPSGNVSPTDAAVQKPVDLADTIERALRSTRWRWH